MWGSMTFLVVEQPLHTHTHEGNRWPAGFYYVYYMAG
jgi:hypothetical protein